jgi:hypothetical protein
MTREYVREIFDAEDVLSQWRTVPAIVTHLEKFPPSTYGVFPASMSAATYRFNSGSRCSTAFHTVSSRTPK